MSNVFIAAESASFLDRYSSFQDHTKKTRLTKLAAFLDHYGSFKSHTTEARLKEFISAFRCIRASMESLQTLTALIERREASEYNIFQILKLQTKEVRTHSAFLANLLKPDGSHGQGALFLKDFIQLVAERSGVDLTVPESDWWKWRVQTEKYTEYGQ